MIRISDLKIGTRLYVSFAMLLALLIAVGYLGWNGMTKATTAIHDISHQLEIAKKANTILVDAQDAQAGSLRFIIYHDDQFFNIVRDESEKVLALADEAKVMMKSEENKAHADEVITAITEPLPAGSR